MSLSQKLLQDLTSLSSESKRRNPEIRHASDKAIELLKTSPDTSNMANLLKLHPDFVDPFLLSCQSRNSKLTGIAVQCLSKLLMVNALPVSKLDIIIDSMLECTHSTPEIQLKLLQMLPTFYQNNSNYLKDELLSRFLNICSSLQGSNKPAAVMNTASATFLQLINLIFEKVDDEDKENTPKSHEVEIDDGEKIFTGDRAYDIQRIVYDLCTLIEHHKPAFLKSNYLTEDFGFELLESVIKNNKAIFLRHVELGYLLRTRVAPITLRFLSSSKDFTIMVRVSKLILLLIKDQFEILKIETEVSLSLLNHTISKESGSPIWKKILSLEIYNLLFKNIDFVQNIIQEYDNNAEEDRKKVFKEFLDTAYSVVVDQKHLLSTSTAVQVPVSPIESNQDSASIRSTPMNTGTEPSPFSYSSSSIRVPYIEMLDKPDPPVVPETYPSFLVIDTIIRLTESICAFGLDLSYVFSEKRGESGISFLDEHSFDGEVEETNFKFIRSLIIISWERILQIFELFIHSVVDHDMFIKVLRSLQKLCHVSGVVGLEPPRNEILLFFSKCTLRLNGKSSLRQKPFSISESIVGTINSAFSTIAPVSVEHVPDSSQALPLYSRDLNSRNVMCFRVLMSLATSLSDILDENWKTILITIQWMSYYLDGPSGTSFKDIPPVSVHLKNQDLLSVETSLKRFSESLRVQSSDIFGKIIKSAIQLSSSVTEIPATDLITGRIPIDDTNKLQPCAFNILFYIDYVTELCELNPTEFLLENSSNLSAINNFYVNLATNRDHEDDTRLYASRNFNVVCKAMGVSGFEKCALLKENNEAFDRLSVITENRTFSSLNELMTNLSKLPMSGDGGILSNAEVEMYLQSLNCLQGLINRFGTLIKKHWEIVFNMVSLPLEIIYGSDDLNKEKILTEIIVSVLRSSFETMKVVLDEMLQSIPIDQIKVIIDCLFKFISQKYDLNISLNSISYFWLISDYTKEKITSEESSNLHLIETSITSESDLINRVTDLSSTNGDRYRCLWTYLVYQLARISQDERTQVRNGSLMTFFSVVESHMGLRESWKLIYGIILEPVIMEAKPSVPLDDLSSVDRKDWCDSLVHVINGLTKLFIVFLEGDPSPELDVVYWKGLISYYQKMHVLSKNHVELNLHVHKSYSSLINNFFASDNIIDKVPQSITEELYKFWANIPISYNLSNDSMYQECVSAHMSAFDGLYKLLKPSITIEKFEKILMIFNACVRYPVIPSGQRDDTKCTDLQQSVIRNMSYLQVEGNSKLTSLLIQQVVLITTLPFSTKDMIEKKLSNRGIRIPSFISVSSAALDLLESIFRKIDDYTPYINNKCIAKTYKSLLECSKVKNINNVGADKIQLWMHSMNILTTLTDNVIKIFRINHKNGQNISIETQTSLWPLIIDAFKTTLIYSQHSDEFEEFDLEKYNQLKLIITNNLNLESVDNALIDELVSTVWTNSFLYALDDVENEIISASESPLEMSKNLAGFKFELIDGSIKPLQQLPRTRISKSCLKDLISFAKCPKSEENSSSSLSILSARAVPYLTSRVAFVLRKFLVDIKLLNKQPLPIIQQAELLIVLQGLSSTISELSSSTKEESEQVYSNLRILSPLFIKCLSLGSKVEGISELISNICISLDSNV